ncbi:alanine racemase [Actimicrobium sp. GrIS 1.19]|uniref:alanine racemase n=1 Tax=Actimicrobium sp. GrIS 1.19 TaxID=3071708 RepID=UPI002E02ABFC|nr:alanine racemase [Actimicrobium sp. GrIS 1.19]
MPRPLVAIIDIAALQHNLTVAKRKTPQARVWAVVKANAYGHGLERALRGFAEADGLALIEPDAAVRLRDLGWRKPILLLEGCFDAVDFAIAAQYQFDIAIHCAEQIALLEQTRFPKPVNIHLKMNSGMNRLGFTPAAFAGAFGRLRDNPAVASITLMTHFANADDADNPALPLAEQLRRFQLGSAGLDAPVSVSNSGATLLHAGLTSHQVRPGVMLYGGSPGTAPAADFDLRPAMTLQSELIGIQQIHAGEAVGYGSRFVAPVPMSVGVVACGYADGYPRHAPTGTPILVQGMRTRVIGNISMDMLTVDLTPVPTAHVGSCVTLWGDDLPIDEVARAAGTIGYELMCAIAPRVRVTER